MRLIDADALKVDYIVPSTSTGTTNTQYVSLHQIINAPTWSISKREWYQKGYEAGQKSVQPQKMRGKWTKDNACEFCGFQPWYERNINTLSFCPNCGADMRWTE